MRRTYLLRITLTEEEEQEAKEAAKTLGVSLASLGRMALFRMITAIRERKEGGTGKKKPALLG